MSLFKGLRRKYPGIKENQFVLRDDSDGRGPQLTYLDPALGAIPSLEELGTLGQVPEVPSVVTKRQFLLALFDEGHINHVQASIQAGTPRQGIDWENTPEVKRDGLFVASIMTRANLSSTQMDAIFIRAIGL